MSNLNLTTPQQLAQFIATRTGETKLGEKVKTISGLEELKSSNAPFVLLGIKEDIGIRANLGQGGAADCWDYALKALVNVQSNRFLSGEQLIVLGALEFPEFMERAEDLHPSKERDLKELRQITGEIDKAVTETVKQIVEQQKIPIIIGGGHNNAYGNIRGTSEALRGALSVLNIDPHTDFRQQEGRHSGNGFRYAREEGLLDQYGVYGLHESYNGDSILQEFQENSDLHFLSFETILDQNEAERYKRFMNFLNWFGEKSFALELDLDSITRFPVSAINPCGFSLNEIRALVRTTATLKQPHYFHICEGSPGRAANELEKELLGKSIAYLITDFIKARSR